MGHWKANTQTWYETNVRNCSLCGKMIPSKMWITEIGGKERIFCDPKCEEMYHDYWEPRYGKQEPGAGQARPGGAKC